MTRDDLTGPFPYLGEDEHGMLLDPTEEQPSA